MLGTAVGFRGRLSDNEAFFVFTSFNSPTTTHRYDVAANSSAVRAKPGVAVDARIVVEQRFYASKDGTRVPAFIIRRADTAGPAPIMLIVCGGYARRPRHRQADPEGDRGVHRHVGLHRTMDGAGVTMVIGADRVQARRLLMTHIAQASAWRTGAAR
jgi:hypothetical protein